MARSALLSTHRRPLAPLRLGSRYAIAGVKVMQSRRASQPGDNGGMESPTSNCIFEIKPMHGRVDHWEQAVKLIHQSRGFPQERW